MHSLAATAVGRRVLADVLLAQRVVETWASTRARVPGVRSEAALLGGSYTMSAINGV